MRRVLRAGVAASLLLFFASFGLFIAAIWSDGPGKSPISQHLSDTGVATLMLAIFLGIGCAASLDLGEWN